MQRDGAQGLAPGRGLVDVVSLVAERGRDGIDDRVLVVDDEDAMTRAARASRGRW